MNLGRPQVQARSQKPTHTVGTSRVSTPPRPTKEHDLGSSASSRPVRPRWGENNKRLKCLESGQGGRPWCQGRQGGQSTPRHHTVVGFSDCLSGGDLGMAGLAMLPNWDNCCSRVYAQQSRVSWHVDGAQLNSSTSASASVEATVSWRRTTVPTLYGTRVQCSPCPELPSLAELLINPLTALRGGEWALGFKSTSTSHQKPSAIRQQNTGIILRIFITYQNGLYLHV